MPNIFSSIENIRFNIFELHKIQDILNSEYYQDHDEESLDMVLSSVMDVAEKDMYPVFREMDEKPAYYEDGKVIIHPAVDKMLKIATDNGWLGSHFDYDDGGSRVPMMLSGAASYIMACANNNVGGYIGLTAGAANLIITFGTQELKDLYVPKMLSGDWTGTMALTEPQAGSSLSDITTKAIPQEDGSYKIVGQKIFISGGDGPNVDNIIHLTLARIEGAPAGTKGISLFVVPKNRISADGSLEDNDVITAGDFQKMGQKGYSTVHLSYGEKNNCHGWMVGVENRGLAHMFQMMNGARLDVGLTAAGVATAAYYHSLQYAKERPQGRKLSKDGTKDVSQQQTTIINHPDVRRMLLLQKSVIEGAFSLITECYKLEDQERILEGEAKEEAHLLLELLTPMAKTYPAEMGQVAITNGLQIYGGYGFCTEFPLQQYYRDIRIMSLYEGTTGIQSLDLLGRKVTMQNGRAMQILTQRISETMAASASYDDLKPYAAKLQAKLEMVQEVMTYLLPFAMKGDYEKYLADASIFMQMASNIVIAWQWLKMGVAAKEILLTKSKVGLASSFYESKIETMKYYYKYELPKVDACKEILTNPEDVTLSKSAEANILFS